MREVLRGEEKIEVDIREREGMGEIEEGTVGMGMARGRREVGGVVGIEGDIMGVVVGEGVGGRDIEVS